MNKHGEKEKARSRTAGAPGAGKSQRIGFRFDRTMIIGRALKVWTNALLKVGALAATVVAIAVQAQAPAANPEHKKDPKSELPWKPRVQPGTTEWARLGGYAEQVTVSDISKADAEKLSTRELMSVCLNYTFIGTMMYALDPQTGPARTISNFYGFIELFKRSDAAEVYLEEMVKREPNQKLVFNNSQRVLIRLLGDSRTRSIFNPHQRIRLAQICLRAFTKPGERSLEPESELIKVLLWCFDHPEVSWQHNGRTIAKSSLPQNLLLPREPKDGDIYIGHPGADVLLNDLEDFRRFVQITGFGGSAENNN